MINIEVDEAIALKKLNKQENIDFCVEKDLYIIVPKYNTISKTFVL